MNKLAYPVYPPACIGILGGGQLGRMLAMVAKQMGYQVAILEPDENCPAKYFADIHIKKAYTDQEGLKQLASIAKVVTTEFENVPAQTIDFLTNHNCPTFPKANAVTIAQNRLKEKSFFRSIGLATAKFAAIKTLEDCSQIDEDFFPAILKTTTQGYDGKGQRRVKDILELKKAYQELGGECILEQMVSLAKEVSIIVARNQHGIVTYPLIENEHVNGILDLSTIPAQVTDEIAVKAQQAATTMVESLEYIGILTIEFFVTVDGELLVNEIAPRPHNSGHITIEASVTSQFEQQLRAVCELPLGSTTTKLPGMMLNLLGDIWQNNSDPLAKIIGFNPNLKLHWYEKLAAKPGRKMGHISIVGENLSSLRETLLDLKKHLKINF